MRKIQKRTAERLYKEGKTILFVPCKISPCNAWGIGMNVSNQEGTDFQKLVNAYTYYNCCYATGYRVAFYIND